ncbi:MAG TPA: TauD/TfdA family dioxygenase [Planctomycetota bacterium]|nr:TauD/TfdA family dioxygenase [Planctomycetota bacterium]
MVRRRERSEIAMTTAHPRPSRPLQGPAVWRGDQLAQGSWIHHWTAPQLAELERALATARGSGRDLASIDRHTFPLDGVAALLANVRRELLSGRGFVLLRGIDPAAYDPIDAATIFWGLGTHLGRALPQNARGHLLGHVTDLGRDAADPGSRIYQTAERQGFHTDSADLVGLFCLQRALAGGRSSLVSCATMHNEMLRRCPELLAELFGPFCTDHRGEPPAGSPPYFTAPILSWFADELSVLYQRRYIESAQRFADVPRLLEQHVAALDAFDAVAEDPDIHLEMDLEPGDMQFIHNHQMLHDRTAFRDDPASGRRRHLLRLWLCPDEGRALPPWFAQRLLSTVPGRRGGVALRGVEPFVTLDPNG